MAEYEIGTNRSHLVEPGFPKLTLYIVLFSKAKPTVQAQAKACINHGDLTSLLYVQGYRRNEWAW